ncbi:bifunctional DNA primase/polymerase [Actinomadura napierensis]|uniref:Bifunctional DNA primase/polymerase n=1 Tax=Actinomadura napierensis TaxID=267854 RepID=A0ABP5KQJ7_9ACTN
MAAPTGSELARAALDCAARGWHVFPLVPRGKRPALHSESRCPRTGPCHQGHITWEDRATTDPERVRRCWDAGPYNVGIACGPSGLVVLDLDQPKPGERPPAAWDQPGINDGADVLAALCELAGQPFPTETFTTSTRRGGMHLYFTAPPGLRLGNTTGRQRNGLGWLIDTRAHGGYVIAPGSHVALPDGTGPYRTVYDVPPAPLPEWLADRLSATQKPEHGAPPLECSPAPAGRVSDTTAYARAALQEEAQRVKVAVIGGRNHALNKAAYHLGRLVGAGALTQDQAYDALWHAASVHFGPLHHDMSPDEAHATITSGLTAGTRNPRQITPRKAA